MTAYLRPANVEQALAALAEAPAVIAAGCTDLFAATQARALSGRVLDITGIDSLRGITRGPEGVRIGAGASWSDVIAADMPPAFDMLKEAAREVGSVQIQNAATLVGNICNASPAADGAPCLLALDAQVELASRAGLRQLPLGAFLTGPRRTALLPGEMVTALIVPAEAELGRSRFLKLGARKYLVISIAMVAVRIVLDRGIVARAAIAVGACSAVATRLAAVEEALIGRACDDMAGAVTAARVAHALSPIDDIRADAPYRLGAAAELVRRAVRDLEEVQA